MLEAKEKDLALFELRERGAGLARRRGVRLDGAREPGGLQAQP